jgi:4-carboxymuconolactone decarboxylase
VSSRLPAVATATMTPEQQGLYDRYATGTRAENADTLRLIDPDTGELLGPPGLWLHHVPLGNALEQLGGVIRFELSVPAPVSELVILVVAHHLNCAFEIHVHEQAARKAGLSDEQITAVRDGARPPGLDGAGVAALDLAFDLLVHGRLSERVRREATEAFGATGVLELTTLVGYYTMLAFQLNAFEVLP